MRISWVLLGTWWGILGLAVGQNCQECEKGCFHCTNGKCVPPSWLCDHEDDCGDLSDEPDTCLECHPTDEHQCDNKQCIAGMYVCNGANDCGDWSDERSPITGKCPACPGQDEWFQCVTSGLCLRISRKCDGVRDCFDGSDEPGTIEDCPPCRAGFSQCNNGRCIGNSYVCNGRNDCGEWEDELEDRCICPPGQIICPNKELTAPGTCYSLEWVCDGIWDCPDGFDEANCASSTFPTRGNI